MYSNANKNYDVWSLMVLVDNESRVDLDEDFYNNSWFARPSTLGDVAYLQIFSIIQKKVKEISYDESIRSNDTIFQANYDRFMNDLKKNKFIEKVCNYLKSGSNTKKDVSVLILSQISQCQRVIKIFACEEYIDLFIEHAYNIKKTSKKLKSFFIF